MKDYTQEENLFRAGYHYGKSDKSATEAWEEFQKMLKMVEKVQRSKPGIVDPLEDPDYLFDSFNDAHP